MLIGLELLFNYLKGNLKSKSDVVIAVLHSFLLNNNYQLIGLGNVEEANDTNGTELLLSGWNSTQDAYIFRYKRSVGKETRILLVKAIKAENLILINTIENPGQLTGGLEIAIDTYITNDFTSYNTAFTSPAYLGQLEEKFKKEIMDKISFSSSKSNHDDQSRNVDPLRIPRRDPPNYPNPNYGYNDLNPFNNRPGFPNIGGKDLNPLGRPGGTGMILDPRELRDLNFPNRNPNVGPNYPSLPPGAVPPGARFDPMFPNMPGDRPNRPRTNDPNPDNFQPPGYDDMFM